MELKYWNRTLLGIVSLILFLSLLVLLKVLFAGDKEFEWGSVSDWVSAGCNVAMAGAAVYAAINAKQWFSQRSHTKGFDKAEEILTRIDSIYNCTNDTLSNLHSTLEYLNAVSDGLTHPDSSRMVKYESLHSINNEHINSLKKLLEEIELIERWSIKIKNKNVINSLLKSLTEVNASAANSFNSARSCVYNITCKSKDDFETSLKYYKRYYEEFLKDFIVVESSYNEFKVVKFTDLFKVQ